MSKISAAAAYLAVALALTSCDRTDNTGTIQPSTPAATPEAPAAELTLPAGPPNPDLAQLAQQQCVQASLASIALNNAVKQLLRSPDAASLAVSRRAWEQAVEHVEALHIFSQLLALPATAQKVLIGQQFALSAWPIEPGYLDAYSDHRYSGLVFDISLPLTAQTLRDQHGLTSYSDASLGLYAIEFLLFGENQRNPAVLAAVTQLDKKQRADGYQQLVELPRNRRRQMLELQAQMLVDDAKMLEQYWSEQQLEVSDVDLLRAAKAMVTQQIIEVAQLQKAPKNERARVSRTLALRLAAQIGGWQLALAETAHPQQPELAAVNQKALEHLQQLLEHSAAEAQQESAESAEAQASLDYWRKVYKSLRRLAAKLSKQAPPDEPPSTEVEVKPKPEEP